MEKSFGEQVRRRRLEQRLSLDALAELSGVSRAALSKIERGERNTRLDNAVRIAGALGAPLGQLLEPNTDEVQVVRSGEAPTIVDPETRVVREALLEPRPGLDELIRYELPAGAAPAPFPAHEPGSQEAFVVVTGTVVVVVGEREIELGPGDAALVPGDLDHALRNPGSDPARLLLLITRPQGARRSGRFPAPGSPTTI